MWGSLERLNSRRAGLNGLLPLEGESAYGSRMWSARRITVRRFSRSCSTTIRSSRRSGTRCPIPASATSVRAVSSSTNAASGRKSLQASMRHALQASRGCCRPCRGLLPAARWKEASSIFRAASGSIAGRGVFSGRSWTSARLWPGGSGRHSSRISYPSTARSIAWCSTRMARRCSWMAARAGAERLYWFGHSSTRRISRSSISFATPAGTRSPTAGTTTRTSESLRGCGRFCTAGSSRSGRWRRTP
jgi:hypothetical protein